MVHVGPLTTVGQLCRDGLNLNFCLILHLQYFLQVVGINQWESVSAMLLGLGRLNIKHLIMLCKVTFYRHSLHSCDVFLCNMFLMFLKTILAGFWEICYCVIIVLFLLCGYVVHNLSLSVFLPCLANKRVHHHWYTFYIDSSHRRIW